MAKYKSKFKVEVVKYYQINGYTSTLKKYNISNTALNKWVRDYKGGTFMRKKAKNYTIEDKLNIIEYYRTNGATATNEKYNISSSVFYVWERILIEEGEQALGIERRGRGPKPPKLNTVNEDEDLLTEVQRLRLENAYLKKLEALTQKDQKLK